MQKIISTSKWSSFYSSKMTELYRTNLAKKYKFYTDLIHSFKLSGKVYEFGCGAGHISRILLEHYDYDPSNLTLYDRDTQMLEMASKNLHGFHSKGRSTVEKRDITARGFGQERVLPASLIHSHGVLEHLTDKGIKVSVSNGLALLCRGGAFVAYVPSSRYTSKAYGDERLMPKEFWQDLGAEVRAFNNGFDLALVWRKE